MAAVFSLSVVPRAVSTETVRELEELLSQARSGELQGIAFVALSEDGSYTVGTVGSVRTRPTYALGALSILKENLLKLIALA